MSATAPTPANGNGNGHSSPAVVHHDDQENFLMRVACDQSITADKLRAVADVYIIMQEKQRAWAREDQAEQARVIAMAARAAMQAELPVLEKDTPNQEGKGKYLDFGDLWEACCPIWTKHGFGVSFDVVPTDNGLIRLVLLLDHKAGHRQTYFAPDTPPDTTGPRGTVNKTIPQGSQSTITYVQRGLLTRSLGIGMKREEDDGNSGSRDDNPHRPHSGATQSRETTDYRRRPPVDWVKQSYERLGATKSPDDWMATLTDILAAAPSATETSQLANRLKAYVEKIPDREKRAQVSGMFRDRMGAFGGKSDTASDNGGGVSDTKSDIKSPSEATRERMKPATKPADEPLTEDEQWAEDQISNLLLIWDIDSFMVTVNDPAIQGRMKKLNASPATRPIYERVKREYEARHARILKENSR